MADVKEEISLQANLVLLVVLKRRHPHLQNRRKHRFWVRSLEALNHGAEFKLLWDTFRSQIAELWFPYDRTIAIDRRWFYLLRSSAIMIGGSQTIAEVCFI